MAFAPLYILNRFVFRLTDFFHHWYIDGSRRYAHGFISFLSGLDKVFALRITLRLFWHPLYGDYTIIGRIVGVVFRSVRILLALVLYAIVSAAAFIIFLIWLSIPFIPLAMAYRSFIAP